MSAENPIMDTILYHIEWLFSMLKYLIYHVISVGFSIISTKKLSVFTFAGALIAFDDCPLTAWADLG